MTIKLGPNEQAAMKHISQSAASLLDTGTSAETIADLLFFVAYGLQARAQGKGDRKDWQEQADSRFLRAATTFGTEASSADRRIAAGIVDWPDFPITKD